MTTTSDIPPALRDQMPSDLDVAACAVTTYREVDARTPYDIADDAVVVIASGWTADERDLARLTISVD